MSNDPYHDWHLPARFARLKDLAYNLWWSWHPEARALFKEVDRTSWAETHHNPVSLLRSVPAERFEKLAADAGFCGRYDAVIAAFDAYMGAKDTWFARNNPEMAGKTIGYFSAEFGVHNSLKIYSGGLGILAGDHCKSASDLGVPLVGVGFMYPQGYVVQKISSDGWQQNVYEAVDWSVSPVRPVLGPSGGRMILDIPLGRGTVKVAVWKVQVGRMPLYLMDTHVEGNSPQDQEITNRLYGGDRTMRLRQEIILGIGGVRVLRALGVHPSVFHANEGHSSFLFLELAREKVASGKPLDAARAEVGEMSVFTTHTPVEAGHDVFAEEMISEYFSAYWPQLGLEKEAFLDLARVPGHGGWNMTALSLKLAGRRNAVSRRHGQVSREMWRSLWPSKPADEVPISHVTNGVHLSTWIQQDLGGIYDRYLGPGWRDNQDDEAVWSKVASIPDEVLWLQHQRNKSALLQAMRARARSRWMNEKGDPGHALAGGALLDHSCLVIGFARRFASYKRATLILRDPERLKRLLLDPWRPIQLVFAGKAHPADDGGKALIQQVYRLAKDPAFGGRVAFIEDYDMHVARYLVQGVDLWLNNPLAPLEACGTSGEKAGMNGVPNFSVLDGWWEEGYNGANGWAIGQAGGRGAGPEADAADAEDIYGALEKAIVPLYYERDEHGVPRGWVKTMKESIRSVAPRYSADRMVKDYCRQLYCPKTGVAA
ncbi:MAG: alpha-glucan family phosphorylase [Elusimicrobiota bacterium]|nr:alpha-glucan family phosphorylase [Elusimicrobiota bacterium]